MTWFGILLIVYWAVNALFDIAMIGRSFKITPGLVVVQITVWSLLAWGAITVGTTRP
jgi:hypothetical protein